MTIRDAWAVPTRVPITTLLSWLWVAHTIGVDNRFGRQPARGSGDYWQATDSWTVDVVPALITTGCSLAADSNTV